MCSLSPTLWDEFDHVNLSTDIPELWNRNVVTEAIAALIAQRTPQSQRVRVWETPDFFAEVRSGDTVYRLGRRYRFHAAHRLNSPALSDDQITHCTASAIVWSRTGTRIKCK